ncbi:hypothetical protein MJO29_007460 [Puccinia striiformis f. sp. tritici]|nr:hypothetical protein MJO29_007460 [Puccinia striiformis f. sp. tritici]
MVDFQPGLSETFVLHETILAPLTDDDEVFFPNLFSRRGFWPGAADKLLALTRSEGVSGPREEQPAILPLSFGVNVTLTHALRDIVSRFSDVFDPIAKLSPALLGMWKERLAGLQDAGSIQPSTSAWSSPNALMPFVAPVYFSKIDLQQGFHQMRIAAADVPKTTLGTKYGHHEWFTLTTS